MSHRRFDARWAIHVSLVATLVCFAVKLWWPDDTFASNHAFAAMAAILPENAWAELLWATACVGSVGLFADSGLTRLFSISIMTTMHILVALLLITSGATLLPCMMMIFAVQGLYMLLRQAHEKL